MNNSIGQFPNNLRMQTKITPIFTKNHGYPRLVQEFQFFINGSVIKYTNVTTSMPDRKDDAFVSQMSQCFGQNLINDYYFDLNEEHKSEEGKIIEEEDKNCYYSENSSNNYCKKSENNLCNMQKQTSKPRFETTEISSCRLFEDLQNKKHALEVKSAAREGKQQENATTIANDQDNREGSRLSGIPLSSPPNAHELSGQEGGLSYGSSSDPEKLQHWRGDEIPDNNERKDVFKVVRKRICKIDKKIGGCCIGAKIGCKVN